MIRPDSHNIMFNNPCGIRPGGFNHNNNFNDGNHWPGNRGGFDYRPPGPPPDFFQNSRPPVHRNMHPPNRFNNGGSFRPPMHQNVHRPFTPQFKQQRNDQKNNSHASPGNFSNRDGNFHGKRGMKRNNHQNPGQSCQKSQNKKQKVDKRDLPENNKFVCEACDRGYKNEEAYKLHCDQHEQCKEEGCSYVAAPKLVQLHYQWQHRTGFAKKIWQLESKEDIEKWREERRKNYPTKANIERKKKVVEEKIARGEVIETRTFGKMRGANKKCQKVKNFLRKANAELNNKESEAGGSTEQEVNPGDRNRKRRRNRNRKRKQSEESEAGEEVKAKPAGQKHIKTALDSDSDGESLQITSVTNLSKQPIDPLSVIVIGDDDTSSEDEEETPVLVVKKEKLDDSVGNQTSSDLKSDSQLVCVKQEVQSGALGALASLYGDESSSESDMEEDIKPQQGKIQDKESVVATNCVSVTLSSNSHSGSVLLKSTKEVNDKKSTVLNSDVKKEKLDHIKTSKRDRVKIDHVETEIRDHIKKVKFQSDKKDPLYTNKVDCIKTCNAQVVKTDRNALLKDPEYIKELELNKVRTKAGQNDSVMALTENKFELFCGSLNQNKSTNNENETESGKSESVENETGKKDKKEKGRTKREAEKSRYKQRPTVSKKRLTLLQKLLAPDIRHERNVVLQCIRYIVKKDFFGLKTDVGPKNTKNCEEKTLQRKQEVDDELWEGEGVL